MGAENDGGAVGHLVQFIDEHRADGAETVHHILVVNDFMPHVDGSAEQYDRPLDDVDGAVHPGAESARIGQEDLHQFFRLASKRASSNRHAAPTVIAESATLNAGKYARSQWKCMKSITYPSRIRSMTLPIAPPSTRARPAASRVCAPRGSLNSQIVMPVLTTTAGPMNTQRCQPEAEARKLKAAPTLCMQVTSRTGRIRTNSNSRKCPSIYALLTWSASTTNADNSSHVAARPRFSPLVMRIDAPHRDPRR